MARFLGNCQAKYGHPMAQGRIQTLLEVEVPVEKNGRETSSKGSSGSCSKNEPGESPVGFTTDTWGASKAWVRTLRILSVKIYGED